jgi:hypothetical protein
VRIRRTCGWRRIKRYACGLPNARLIDLPVSSANCHPRPDCFSSYHRIVSRISASASGRIMSRRLILEAAFEGTLPLPPMSSRPQGFSRIPPDVRQASPSPPLSVHRHRSMRRPQHRPVRSASPAPLCALRVSASATPAGFQPYSFGKSNSLSMPGNNCMSLSPLAPFVAYDVADLPRNRCLRIRGDERRHHGWIDDVLLHRGERRLMRTRAQP